MNSVAPYIAYPFASRAMFRVRNLQILLVEDDEADAYLIRRALTANAKVSQVVHAWDGIEALELLDNYDVQPDLAIVDLNMPRKDGLSLLKDFAIRECAQFPAIVLTSSTAGTDILRCWKHGAVEFMSKRSSATEMAAALDYVLSNIH